MGEYKATEQELKNALLSVRLTDWEYLSARLDRRADMLYGRGADSFSCFMEFKASDNYSEMLEAELGAVQEWKELCLKDMMIELNSASMDCRKRFNRLVKRYFTGLKKMLLDIVYDKTRYGKHLRGVDGEKEREYWEGRLRYLEGVDEFKPGDKSERDDIAKRDSLFLANENGATHYPFTENDLIQKILVFQELLGRLSVEPSRQTAEPATGGAADRQFIGWRGTPEQLEGLAKELQEEKFIADAESFKGQFRDTGATVEEPCRWLSTDRSLVHLLEKLLSKKVIPIEANIPKTAIAHFCKKDGEKYGQSLVKNISNHKHGGDIKSRGFKTIDTIISEVFP